MENTEINDPNAEDGAANAPPRATPPQNGNRENSPPPFPEMTVIDPEVSIQPEPEINVQPEPEIEQDDRRRDNLSIELIPSAQASRYFHRLFGPTDVFALKKPDRNPA